MASPIDPALSLRAITPNDTTDLPNIRALFIGGAGNIAVLARNDTVPVTMAVTAGMILPVQAKRVYSTGTTATGIVALM